MGVCGKRDEEKRGDQERDEEGRKTDQSIHNGFVFAFQFMKTVYK